MHSRRDQVEAHSFVTNRLRSALLWAKPDSPLSPLRRTPVGLVIGCVLGALVIAGVAVLSLLKPGGGQAWRESGVLIVEKQTGTRYVLSEGRLLPVLNYASARLLLGEAMRVEQTSAKSLSRVPRGGQIGIVGAPDTLPDPAKSGDQPWLVCAASVRDAEGAERPALAVLIGPTAVPSPDSRLDGALVRTPDGAVYLAAGGRRMRLGAPWVGRALGLDDRSALPVRSSWVNAMPAGPDLGRLPIDGRGEAGPRLDGRLATVGQVFTVRSAGTVERHYLVTSRGLMQLNDTAVALVLGDPATADSYGAEGARALPLSPTALASADIVDTPPWVAGLPPMPRTLGNDQADFVPCVLVVTGAKDARTALVWLPAAAAEVAGSPEGPVLVRDGLTADRVALPPGGGLLARTRPAPGVSGAGLFLVVENGAKYPVEDEEAAEALGYSPQQAAAVPAGLLAMLPTGPMLGNLGSG